MNKYQIQSIKLKRIGRVDYGNIEELSYQEFMNIVRDKETTLKVDFQLGEKIGIKEYYWESSWLDSSKTAYLYMEEKPLSNGEIVVALRKMNDYEELGVFQYDETLWNWIIKEWADYLKCNSYRDSVNKTMKEIELHNFKKALDKKYEN